MEKQLLYTIPSLYRDDFRIEGYRFGAGRPALAIVGSVRGNEYQQIYTCSQLVQRFRYLEREGYLDPNQEILVIPSLNPCSMNIGKRFWPTDNTDINRMFPGYDRGETTQRIAAGVFRTVSAYENGIQFASYYMPGRFCPHVRMMKTGYENIDKARSFGLPYVVLRNPRPYDTTTLNYNWQIWDTDAFSLYTTTTDTIDEDSAEQTIQCVLRFLAAQGLLLRACSGTFPPAPKTRVFSDSEMVPVRPSVSGIFRRYTDVAEFVRRGRLLAEVLNPCDGEPLEQLTAPSDGIVFFLHSDPLVYAQTAAIKLLKNY